MDHFDVNALRTKLQTRWLGRHLFYESEIGSTNDELKRLNEANTLPTGTLFITDYQNQGRGRFARRWEAPSATSLLFSLLLRPNWPAEQNGWLTMMASLAVAEAIIAQTSLTARIKWPNDVVLWVDNGWRKVSGILLEGDIGADGRCHQAIVGLGINVNIPADLLPAGITPPTSLLVASGQSVARPVLLHEVLRRLEKLYDAALDGRSPQPAWLSQLITVGQPVTVTFATGDEPMTGTAVGVDEWGHLLVQTEDGRQHTILAADVTLRQLNQ